MFAAWLAQHRSWANPTAPVARSPFPTAADRDAWAQLPARETLLDWGDEAKAGYPPLTATQYLAYARTGDRQALEQPYFQRRMQLIGATLAECTAGDGRYLDTVIDGVWHLCEESSWVLSAHNGAADGKPSNEKHPPLPDVGAPLIDLFAAQTAATLAHVQYLLGAQLDCVTPLLRRRVKAELDQRVLTPFLTRDDFWWMGSVRKSLNNWTPWILSNMIDTFLLVEENPERLWRALVRAMEMLDRYLACQPEDGGCDEGCGYWNMAGASLLDCLESLRLATGGAADFYGDPLVRRIAAFPLHAHITGDWYWNFADCDAKPLLDGERVRTFGERTQNEALAALGAQIVRSNPSPLPMDTPQMNRVLHALFAKPVPEVPPLSPTADTALPRLQVFAFQRGDYYASLKGGHNGENHNHNDVGTVIVFIKGQPFAVDAGNLTYMQKTFSSERYTLWNTRAANHNIPIVGGLEQREGAEYHAEHPQLEENGVSMALQGAYPAEAHLHGFRRALRVLPSGVTVTDELHFAQPKPVTWVWMLRDQPVASHDSSASITLTAGSARLEADAPLRFHATETPITDSRMARSFPGSLWRVTLDAEPATHHRVQFSFLGDEQHG